MYLSNNDPNSNRKLVGERQQYTLTPGVQERAPEDGMIVLDLKRMGSVQPMLGWVGSSYPNR